MRPGSPMIDNGVTKVEGWEVLIRRYGQFWGYLSNLSITAASVLAECCRLSAEVAGMWPAQPRNSRATRDCHIIISSSYQHPSARDCHFMWAIPQYLDHLHREILFFWQKSLRTIHTYHLVSFKLPKNIKGGIFQGILVFYHFFPKIYNFTK